MTVRDVLKGLYRGCLEGFVRVSTYHESERCLEGFVQGFPLNMKVRDVLKGLYRGFH